ncbi:cobyrinate a,c-diamide synthase [Sulfuricurvum sp.]|uniref:cobyrinate a,c-diamide synthase n=1 Tax=Sulfuricurvum sp. TaxID=2025608 RepID=UPI003BAEF91C
MVNLCISAVSSNQGKTILTSALLYMFKDSVRPFKAGPDFIDPQFHRHICGTESINLDGFMMNPAQVQWLYRQYSDKEVSIVEGVMGFYDGMDKKSSAYDISKLLNIPTILLMDGSGSYITISAVLKGLKTYKRGNTIRGVILNRIGSQSHYELIKTQIEKDFNDVAVLGWISNHLSALRDTHLGLDLKDMDKLEEISKEVLEHIDIGKLTAIGECEPKKNVAYPFKPLPKTDKKIAVVSDENFSFLYHDNLRFLEEVFSAVAVVRPSHDETIPEDCDSVYICGGYVETERAYAKIKNANLFRTSLIRHAQTKKIYAECAGLLYLGHSVDEKEMSGILDVSFTLEKRFQRLGYYTNEAGVKGHAFHYTKPVDDSKGFDLLSKGEDGSVGSWQSANGNVLGTYLHTLFRSNPSLVKRRLM